MQKVTFATIAASALAALTIGLAAPAVAAPSGTDQDTVTTVQAGPGSKSDKNAGNQTPYGTYQNDDKRQSDR